MASRIETDLLNLIATEDVNGGISVQLPEAVRENQDVMLWMYHYAFDMMRDLGRVVHNTRPVEELLEILSPEIVAEFVLDLVYEANEATKKAKKLRRSIRSEKVRREMGTMVYWTK